jgi:multimeric flavodoxin WrbA
VRVLALSSSPRRDGNSRMLAEAALAGAADAGHDIELVHVADHVREFLRDCRRCRLADGGCGIDDGFERAFLDSFLPSEGILLATPVYWYGMSGQLKTFLDRMFCYIAASHPRAEEVVAGLSHKRIGLVLSSEESYHGASAGILHQVQEYARYTHSEFVGTVAGYGNRRGDVARDPSDPLGRARDLGRRLFDVYATDYRIDTPRSGSVWPVADPPARPGAQPARSCPAT